MAEDSIDFLPMVRQRLLLDILPCDKANDYWDVLDLTPPSKDVADVMHSESHRRLNTVAPLQQFVEPYVLLVGDMISGIMYKDACGRMDADGTQVDRDEFRRILVEQNREVLRGAIYPILAVMLETKVIGIGDVAKAFM